VLIDTSPAPDPRSGRSYCNLYPLCETLGSCGVTMSAQISAVIKACVAGLRRIRSVRRWIPRRALLTLIQALVVSKVDYCNSVLAGVSATQLRRLQSVLNAAGRLVFSARRSEHSTPLLRELHWLRVPGRIKFRLCVLPSDAFMDSLHRCLHRATVPRRDPATDNDLQFPPCRHVDIDHSSYVSTDPWRSCVSSCSCPCPELSAVLCQGCTVTGNL